MQTIRAAGIAFSLKIFLARGEKLTAGSVSLSDWLGGALTIVLCPSNPSVD
jgi:hypothetical protein